MCEPQLLFALGIVPKAEDTYLQEQEGWEMRVAGWWEWEALPKPAWYPMASLPTHMAWQGRPTAGSQELPDKAAGCYRGAPRSSKRD